MPLEVTITKTVHYTPREWEYCIVTILLTLSLPRVPEIKIHDEFQIVPCESTAGEVSFEWSYHKISSTDSKARTTLDVSLLTLGVKGLTFS